MGTKNQTLLLIDWDLKDWNVESQTFEVNADKLEIYNDMVDKLGEIHLHIQKQQGTEGCTGYTNMTPANSDIIPLNNKRASCIRG